MTFNDYKIISKLVFEYNKHGKNLVTSSFYCYNLKEDKLLANFDNKKTKGWDLKKRIVNAYNKHDL